jgi:hypothetical protein
VDAQSGLTGFTLEYKTANASSWSVYRSDISGLATSINVAGLAAGTEYNFRLKAKNDVGTSAASATYTNRTAANGENYAVLFAGGANKSSNYKRYYDQIFRLYNVLTTDYHLSKSNIYVIYADGTNSGIDRNDGQNSDMSFAQGSSVYSATSSNLSTVFNTLGQKMGTNDHLLFFMYDHGGGTKKDTSRTNDENLTGWGTSIADSTVAANVTKIQRGYVTLCFAQCFSGGILDEIIDPVTGANAAVLFVVLL